MRARRPLRRREGARRARPRGARRLARATRRRSTTCARTRRSPRRRAAGRRRGGRSRRATALAGAREAESRAARSPSTRPSARRSGSKPRRAPSPSSSPRPRGDLWPPAARPDHRRRRATRRRSARRSATISTPRSTPSAPAHWAETGAGDGDPRPAGGRRARSPTSSQAPAALAAPPARRSASSSSADGAAPARRARSPASGWSRREGDLWRWDGFTAAAEAPSAAARRLAEKNRLGDLEREAAEARERPSSCAHEAEAAPRPSREAAARETQAHRGRAPGAGSALDAARDAPRRGRARAKPSCGQRRSALQEAPDPPVGERGRGAERVQDAEAALADLAPGAGPRKPSARRARAAWPSAAPRPRRRAPRCSR